MIDAKAALAATDEFVGRREQLALMLAEFERARSRPRFVLLEGEAGIGKSRLVKQFVTGIGLRATHLAGQCSEHGRSPYLPLRALLAQLRDRPAEKAALFEAVQTDLARATARKPAIVSVDDVQWADAATLELLTFLMQHLDSARALFLLTFRTESAAENAPLAMFRHRAARARATIVRLNGLHPNETRRLAAQLARERGSALPAEVLSRVESLAEGNPLFAQELVHVFLETGRINLAAHMPLSVQAVFAQRLTPMQRRERDVLVRAAILGQRFDASMLASVADVSNDVVLGVMQRAVDAGIVTESEERHLEFTFRHAMIRQALADQLILSLAIPLHVRIAEELQALPDADARVAELAYHWSEARDAGKARSFNERAAEAAWNLYAYRDAIDYYSAALRWDYPEGPHRAAIFQRLGTLLSIEGCGEEPAAWFQRSREEYERAGDTESAAFALLLLADQHWVDARTSASLEAAQRAAQAFRELGKPSLEAAALLSLARFSVTLGDAAAAARHLEAARALEAHFDHGTRVSFVEVRADVNAANGLARDALRDAQEACRLAHESGDAELVAQVENNFALVAVDLGELDVAAEHHERAVAEARRTRMAWRVAYSALNYAQTLLLQGEAETARELVQEALDCGVTTATFKTKAAAVGIPLALALNDRALLTACADESALELAERSGEIQRIGSVAAAFAALRLAQGSTVEARAFLDRALDALATAHRCWNLFPVAASCGDAARIDKARALWARTRGRPRVRRAYRLLFEALVARAAGVPAAEALAPLAARAFSSFGCAYGTSLALGDRAEGKARPPALSARQSEIARLVAEGETNRSIAQRLSISEHTVEHHLSAIFSRLGIRSRSQLAAHIAVQ